MSPFNPRFKHSAAIAKRCYLVTPDLQYYIWAKCYIFTLLHLCDYQSRCCNGRYFGVGVVGQKLTIKRMNSQRRCKKCFNMDSTFIVMPICERCCHQYSELVSLHKKPALWIKAVLTGLRSWQTRIWRQHLFLFHSFSVRRKYRGM